MSLATAAPVLRSASWSGSTAAISSYALGPFEANNEQILDCSIFGETYGIRQLKQDALNAFWGPFRLAWTPSLSVAQIHRAYSELKAEDPLLTIIAAKFILKADLRSFSNNDKVHHLPPALLWHSSVLAADISRMQPSLFFCVQWCPYSVWMANHGCARLSRPDF